jgi:hypothetical protein
LTKLNLGGRFWLICYNEKRLRGFNKKEHATLRLSMSPVR